MKTIEILKEKEVVYQKVSEQFTIKINRESDDGSKAFSPILTLRFTSDDNGSEPILVWNEDEETWVELYSMIDELNLSINDYEIIEELISSNVLQQYENDDVIDVASELGIEEDSV